MERPIPFKTTIVIYCSHNSQRLSNSLNAIIANLLFDSTMFDLDLPTLWNKSSERTDFFQRDISFNISLSDPHALWLSGGSNYFNQWWQPLINSADIALLDSHPPSLLSNPYQCSLCVYHESDRSCQADETEN